MWLKEREEAGRRIEPNSADVEITFCWAEVLDPYGVLDLPPEANCVGRSYFARSPDSGGWVSFYDLLDQTRNGLWRRKASGELVYALSGSGSRSRPTTTSKCRSDTGSIIGVTAPTDESMWPTSAAQFDNQPLLRDAILWWRL